jgi:hypothetical protein
MKLKLAVAALAAFLLLAGSAEAFQWHMRYGQAKHASRQYAVGACEQIGECTAFAVGQCYRISASRFDCQIGIFTPGVETEEIECNQMLHWGVSYTGRVQLKNSGEPNCFAV